MVLVMMNLIVIDDFKVQVTCSNLFYNANDSNTSNFIDAVKLKAVSFEIVFSLPTN